MDELVGVIDGFTSWFQANLRTILQLKCLNKGDESHLMIYKKSLLSSLLDSLAAVALPEVKQNHERFTKFVGQYSSWSDSNRVSFPHIARVVELYELPIFALAKRAIDIRFKWNDGDVIPISSDPDIEDIVGVWPSDQELKLNKLNEFRLERLTHKYLLYHNRNSLVHSLSQRTYSFEQNEKTPFYSSVQDLSTGKSVFNLVYPLGFYEYICSHCIVKLGLYLKDNRINPYERFCFGDYYIDKLNC